MRRLGVRVAPVEARRDNSRVRVGAALVGTPVLVGAPVGTPVGTAVGGVEVVGGGVAVVGVLVSGLGYADRVATLTTLATPHLGSDAVLLDFFSAQNFSRETLAAFNEAYPDAPEVRYFSWSFRSCQLLQFSCLANSSGELVDALLVPTHTLLSRFGDNDGIVPTESMRWGEWLGLRFADHFDQVGQIADFGLGPDAFDHLAFYLDEARRLRDLGG